MPHRQKADRIEPVWTIRRTPLLFASGAVFIGSTAVLLTCMLYDRSSGLALGLPAVWQGVAYAILLPLCTKRAASRLH